MKKLIVFTLIYFTFFYILNSLGYKELWRKDNIVQYERFGFPYNSPFVIQGVDKKSPGQLEQEVNLRYNEQTYWLHMHNGIPWFLVYFVIIFFLVKKKNNKVCEEIKL